MKSKHLLLGMLFAGTVFTGNAQNVISNANLTSGGYQAGTSGQLSTYYGHRAGVTAGALYNTIIGSEAGSSLTSGPGNTFVGSNSGKNTTTGGGNIFVGSGSGILNITGSGNVFLGGGVSNTAGSYNIFLGSSSGLTNSSGESNIAIGYYSGSSVKTGQDNISIGRFSGHSTTSTNTGSYNIAIGAGAGTDYYGTGNIFIGRNAGSVSGGATGSNKLFIDNTGTATPLIWGDFALDQLKLNGKVGIGGISTFPATAGGINVSAYKLFVKGGILTEEVRVSLQNTWADYVFAKDYKLAPLAEVEKFITDNGHLPNVPSAAQVKQDGIELGDMARIQQEKIEELTLYIIAQDKQLQEQKQKIEALEKQQAQINELTVLVKAMADKK